MEHFYLRPSTGAKVRDPVTKEHLQYNDGRGELKPRSNYWLRRVEEGVAVVVIKPAADEKKAAVEKGR